MQTVFFRFPGRHCETHCDDTPLSGVSSRAEGEGRRNVIPAADAMTAVGLSPLSPLMEWLRLVTVPDSLSAVRREIVASKWPPRALQTALALSADFLPEACIEGVEPGAAWLQPKILSLVPIHGRYLIVILFSFFSFFFLRGGGGGGGGVARSVEIELHLGDSNWKFFQVCYPVDTPTNCGGVSTIRKLRSIYLL